MVSVKKADVNQRLGRPVFDPDDQVRERLLQAAVELFAKYEFKAVSARKIAASAGVNTAMVHYYFSDKRGLYMAVMEKVSLPAELALLKTAKRNDLSINEFIEDFSIILLENPWYSVFLIREGIFGDGPIREATSNRIVTAMAPAMLLALENEKANGRLRENLDLKLLALSISSLLAFPHFARPLVERSLGFTFDRENIKRLTQHTIEILLYGIRNQDGHNVPPGAGADPLPIGRLEA